MAADAGGSGEETEVPRACEGARRLREEDVRSSVCILTLREAVGFQWRAEGPSR